jgi:DNA mismatch repair ATPase MutS
VYAADLDLFGERSLYALLCTARTPMGAASLARWLLHPADVATIHARHAGIAELSTRLDFREDLAILGGPRHIALQPDTLATWLDGPEQLAA